MKFITNSLLAAAVLMTLAGNANAQFLMAGDNLPGATGILGVNDGTDLSALGTAYVQNANTSAIADGSLGTQATTYLRSEVDSYVGFTFASPAYKLTALTVNFQIFGNGGWFGPRGQNPATITTPLGGDMMSIPSILTEPMIQVLYHGSTTWTTVAESSDYLTVLGPDSTGGNQFSTGKVTFTLDTAAFNVAGIRVIGSAGGDGFIGVAEETALGVVPEPSTYAMMIAGLAFLGFCIRRKSATVK